MNKRICLLFGLIVFIALFAMSYVSAGQTIDLDIDSDDCDGEIQNGQVPITDTENKVLRDGKSISKKVTIAKEVKTYGKTKKLTIKTIIKKKTMKKQINKAVKGKSVDFKLNDKLFEAKISKITFKNFRFTDHGYKYTGLKIIIKYKPAVYKTVTKTTKAIINVDEDGYSIIKYVNPFTGKKELECGDLRVW